MQVSEGPRALPGAHAGLLEHRGTLQLGEPELCGGLREKQRPHPEARSPDCAPGTGMQP